MSESKIITLGKKYLALLSEINKNMEILGQYKKDIEYLLRDTPEVEMISKESKIKIVKEIVQTTKFNTTQFKKDLPKVWSSSRKSSLRFDQKLLESEHPDIYKQYQEIKEDVKISIENYVPDTLDINDIPEF